MTTRSVSLVTVTLALSHFALGCAPDLGPCDMPAARTVVYTDDAAGMPAYEGQALMLRSCGGGSFCHAEGIANADRHGAPHGMDFGVGLATEIISTERLRRAQQHVYDYRGDILGTVEGKTMPPGEIGQSIRSTGPRYAGLPEIDTPEGTEILRNWLSCGSPVVERIAEDRPPGVPAVGAVIPAMGAACTDTMCGTECADLMTNARHCGGCDVACGSGQYCNDGTCAACAGVVSFAADVQPLFASKGCAASGVCHMGSTAASSLDLTPGMAFGELVGVPSLCPDARPLVTAGDPSASYLLNKLTGQGMCSGVRMPVGFPTLTNVEVRTIETWICGGALND